MFSYDYSTSFFVTKLSEICKLIYFVFVDLIKYTKTVTNDFGYVIMEDGL